jgi:hypothetical protein
MYLAAATATETRYFLRQDNTIATALRPVSDAPVVDGWYKTRDLAESALAERLSVKATWAANAAKKEADKTAWMNANAERLAMEAMQLKKIKAQAWVEAQAKEAMTQATELQKSQANGTVLPDGTTKKQFPWLLTFAGIGLALNVFKVFK